jgi:hypothetical protein
MTQTDCNYMERVLQQHWSKHLKLWVANKWVTNIWIAMCVTKYNYTIKIVIAIMCVLNLNLHM